MWASGRKKLDLWKKSRGLETRDQLVDKLVAKLVAKPEAKAETKEDAMDGNRLNLRLQLKCIDGEVKDVTKREMSRRFANPMLSRSYDQVFAQLSIGKRVVKERSPVGHAVQRGGHEGEHRTGYRGEHRGGPAQRDEPTCERQRAGLRASGVGRDGLRSLTAVPFKPMTERHRIVNESHRRRQNAFGPKPGIIYKDGIALHISQMVSNCLIIPESGRQPDVSYNQRMVNRVNNRIAYKSVISPKTSKSVISTERPDNTEVNKELPINEMKETPKMSDTSGRERQQMAATDDKDIVRKTNPEPIKDKKSPTKAVEDNKPPAVNSRSNAGTNWKDTLRPNVEHTLNWSSDTDVKKRTIVRTRRVIQITVVFDSEPESDDNCSDSEDDYQSCEEYVTN